MCATTCVQTHDMCHRLYHDTCNVTICYDVTICVKTHNACHHPCYNAYHHQCHNVTYSVKTHDACHCPCNDTRCVPWLCHRLAMTCIMTHYACRCPCNDTRCVSWLCHNLAMTHYACFVFYIFKCFKNK